MDFDIVLSFDLVTPLEIDLIRESAAEDLSHYEAEFDIMIREDDICEEGATSLIIGIKNFSTTGFRLVYNSDRASMLIPGAASRHDFIYAVSFAHTIFYLNNPDSETAHNEPPVCASVDMADELWHRRMQLYMKRLMESLSSDNEDNMIQGITREFNYDASFFPSCVPERYRLDIFMRMFVSSQWRFYSVGMPMSICRKVRGVQEFFYLLDNTEEECVIYADRMIGLLLDNKLKLVEGSRFITQYQWEPWMTRLDALQAGIKKVGNECWREIWSGVPEEPVKSFSRMYLLRRDSGVDPAAALSAEEWRGLVNAFNRGRAYFRLPASGEDLAMRAGDLVAIYRRQGDKEGVMAYGRIAYTTEDAVVFQPYIMMNPDSGAFLLSKERLMTVFGDYDWGNFDCRCERLTNPLSGVLRSLLEVMVSQFSSLPNVIPSEGEDADFAVCGETLLPLEVIDASPYLEDTEFIPL